MRSNLVIGAIFLTIILDLRRTIATRSDTKHYEPIDWQVHFESGKESAKLYEPNSALFVKRNLKVQNLAGPGLTAKLICHDPFFSTSNDSLQYGDVWEFYILDFFSRRHYYCSVEFKGVPGEYTFRAYGEGAPRANNKIIVLKDKAKINGRDVTIRDDESNSVN